MVTRRASVLWTVLIASVITFVASQAWAVVVNMTVRDADGPVSDVKITFTPEPEDPNLITTTGITGITDRLGNVLDGDGKPPVLLPGRYKRHAKGSEIVTYEDTVTIGPGDTWISIIVVERIMPWMVQNPPCSLCFGLGVGYYGQSADDPELTPGEITIISIPGFPPIIERDGSVVNRFNLSLDAATVHIPVGISTIHVGSLRLYPALNFQAGGGNLKMNSVRRSDNLTTLSLDGSAVVGGAGFGVIATCPNCSWYLGATYDWTLVDAELKDAPCPLFGSVTRCKARADVISHSHSISGRVGFLLTNWLGLYGGINATWQNYDLKLHASQVFSGLVEVTFDTTAQFAHDTVGGIAGMHARFWGPFFGHLETTFNGSDVSLMFKIIYGFSWVDP